MAERTAALWGGKHGATPRPCRSEEGVLWGRRGGGRLLPCSAGGAGGAGGTLPEGNQRAGLCAGQARSQRTQGVGKDS